MSDDADWLSFKRSPEQRAIILERSDRQYRKWVWRTINTPKSLRPSCYAMMPQYLVDKVQGRIREIEKQNSTKKRLSKLFTWRK